MNQTPQDWLTAFSTALSAQDIPAITLLFHETCYWRDLLTFTWNIKTMEGQADIAAMLVETLKRHRPRVGASQNHQSERRITRMFGWPLKRPAPMASAELLCEMAKLSH